MFGGIALILVSTIYVIYRYLMGEKNNATPVGVCDLYDSKEYIRFRRNLRLLFVTGFNIWPIIDKDQDGDIRMSFAIPKNFFEENTLDENEYDLKDMPASVALSRTITRFLYYLNDEHGHIALAEVIRLANECGFSFSFNNDNDGDIHFFKYSD